MTIKIDLNYYKNNFKKYEIIESKLIIDFCKKLKPSASIMIPTFKRSHLIKETIDSAIGQEADIDFEVVIVDNDADCEYSDELEKLIKTYKNYNIRYFRNNANIGMFGNWNRCIELARGKWVSILNDDDCLKSNFIAATHRWKKTNGLIFVDFENACSSEEMKSLQKKTSFRGWSESIERVRLSHLFWRNPVNGSLGVLFERDKAIELGGYNDQLYPTADYYFTLCYWNNFGANRIKNKLAIYRWGENESMKVDTLIGFLKNNRKLRDDIIKKLIIEKTFFKSLYKLISDFLTIRECLAYKKINSNFQVNKVLNDNNVYSGRLIKLFTNPGTTLIAKLIVKTLDVELLSRVYSKASRRNG